MAEIVVADDIRQYLLNSGLTDVYTDGVPDSPIELVSVFDGGGAPTLNQAPESYREINFEVRTATHTAGYEKIWNILNLILYPTGGTIQVNGNTYAAQLREIPAVYDRDSNKNYIFQFSAYLYKVVTVNDPWLSSLVSWTENVLGSGWSVYAGVPGNQRPCVMWQMTGAQADPVNIGMYQVTKSFTATLLAETMDQLTGAATITQELGDSFKICIDTTDNRYVTAKSAKMTTKAGDYSSATITVDLMRKTNRLNQEFYTAGSTTPAQTMATVDTNSNLS